MRSYLLNAAIAGLICLLLSPIGWTQDQDLLSDSEARSVVLTYLDALGQGDTFAIKQLLGGEYLESRRSALDNPAYSNMLSERYSIATSTIINTEQINGQNIAVDTEIELSAQETLHSRFILALDENEQIKIIGEEDYTNQN